MSRASKNRGSLNAAIQPCPIFKSHIEATLYLSCVDDLLRNAIEAPAALETARDASRPQKKETLASSNSIVSDKRMMMANAITLSS